MSKEIFDGLIIKPFRNVLLAHFPSSPTLSIWLAVHKIDSRTEISTNIPNVANILNDMKLYETDEGIKANWDSMQRSLRCCGSKEYELGFRSWETALGGNDVPDSCCHKEDEGCGRRKIGPPNRAVQNDIGIWKDGCIEILEVMLKEDLLDFSWIYIGVGLILALVELITVVLACAYVAQINR